MVVVCQSERSWLLSAEEGLAHPVNHPTPGRRRTTALSGNVR